MTRRAKERGMVLTDRRSAGRLLAERLTGYAGRGDVCVLALPRGGVPVAFEVAERLDASLDVFLVRKLGVPGHEELAMGAIASGGVLVLNHDVVDGLAIPPEVIDAVVVKESEELWRREQAYRDDRPPPSVIGQNAILVDDGLATGASMQSAIEGLRRLGPAQVVVGVPVAARGAIQLLRPLVDELACVLTPEPFFGVGYWYEDFSQTSDDEVRELLQLANERYAAIRSHPDRE